LPLLDAAACSPLVLFVLSLLLLFLLASSTLCGCFLLFLSPPLLLCCCGFAKGPLSGPLEKGSEVRVLAESATQLRLENQVPGRTNNAMHSRCVSMDM
jgi:hypothetical protein